MGSLPFWFLFLLSVFCFIFYFTFGKYFIFIFVFWQLSFSSYILVAEISFSFFGAFLGIVFIGKSRKETKIYELMGTEAVGCNQLNV